MEDNTWKAVLRRAALWSLPFVLTAFSLAWTVDAAGEILSRQAPVWLAYMVAVAFDAVWLYALAAETAHRRQGSRGLLPSIIGWASLGISVAVLFTHGLVYSTATTAVIGAVIPAAAKATLIVAVDWESNLITPDAQGQIDAIRRVTRDQTAIGRAVTRAKTSRQITAAALERAQRKALGDAQKERHQAGKKLQKVTQKHPVTEQADLPTAVPALFTDDDLARVLGEWEDGGVSPGVSPVSPQVSPVSQVEAITAPTAEPEAAEEPSPYLYLSGLAEVATVAGVATPIPGEALDDDQLTVVLRWLRHSENPPMSYRKALTAYRAAGFSAKEERIRKAYADLVESEGAEA